MKEERIYSVYLHTSPSGKYYVGITKQEVEKRWNNGNGYSNNVYFYRAIKKYGWNNFQHEVIASRLTKEEAENFEIRLIEELHSSENDYGYNISLGGNARNGTKHSEETKKKLSKIRKSNPILLSEEGRKKISETHRGNTYNLNRKFTEERKEKISKANRGENHPLYGKHHTEEARHKISQSNKDRVLSEEHKEKISKALKEEKHPLYGKHHTEETKEKMSKANKGKASPMKGKKHTEEVKQKLSELKKEKYAGGGHPRAKKVYCDGMIFDCVKDCASFYNIGYTTLLCWLKGSRKLPQEWEEKDLKYII